MTSHPARLEVPARLDRLASVRSFVRQSAGALGCEDGALEDLVQAVDECVTNVIVHGYHGEDGPVELEIVRTGTDVVVRIRDEAGSFDPTGVATPDMGRSLEAGTRGGMGVHLMRGCVDDLRHRDLPGGGNELTMVKRIEAGTAEGGRDGLHD